ncbi:hypothetical protein HUE87_05470 [Candidatus Sulfurimonas marisnigri]|uniref:Uncharacterized protein n=1 Tax=Candidatus Sulfurimonas marisnigri TaxID=2740405 RepID=A0A7S7M281_9BACT|nr:hypothetical protein [Candidatus Sulfurimonas marisnigri]QOY55675.1 hypothetical protein HUE87_05470 [Candidatus Sulfurimonas marisnigri]
MLKNSETIVSLLDYVKIDRFYVVCHFKCKTKNKTIVSSVPFEPYDGKIEITWQDMLLHPIKSYNRYYHTPIIIYGNDCHETIVIKAFEKVSSYFDWNQEEKKYIFH